MDSDNYKSYEFTFLYLINKCILLFKYIDNEYQKEILNDIKLFINKIQDFFLKIDFKTNEEKKNKILDLLIDYFETIIDKKIYDLIIDDNKEAIIQEAEKSAFLLCENYEKKNNGKKILQPEDNIKKVLQPEYHNIKKILLTEDNSKKTLNNPDYNNNDLILLEKKINAKIKLIFNDIENNIKTSLKDYFQYTQNIEYDLDKKFNSKIDNKVKEILNHVLSNNLNEVKIYDQITELVNERITDLKSTFDSTIKDNINNEIDYKIRLLGNIFNENIEKIFNNLNNHYFISFSNEINNSNFNKNRFNILYEKDNNEIKLYYCNDLITSTKINIKGLIGPKGPQGNKGDNGDTPIIRKIQFTDNNKLKFIVQESANIYEVISDQQIPLGPKGNDGPRGEPGKSMMDLKWNQDNVMRIDEDNKESVIFLKSLCVGDKSHCLKDNSLSIAGAKCYQNNSIGIGSSSKTLDSESIALFGTCIGKRSFSYRADNVDENCIEFGKKDKLNYNINSFNINSKEINLDCDSIKIKTNKYENNKLKDLEDRIILIEKKLIEIYKKI